MNRQRGQGILEYVVLFVALTAALLIMQRLIKGSIMGSWKQTADTFGGGQQYEPGVTHALIDKNVTTISYCTDRVDTQVDETAATPKDVLDNYCSGGGFGQFQ